MTAHLIGAVIALLPAVVTVVALHVATRREGPRPTLTPAGIAYREKRQCTTAIYSWSGGYPDRCAYPPRTTTEGATRDRPPA